MKTRLYLAGLAAVALALTACTDAGNDSGGSGSDAAAPAQDAGGAGKGGTGKGGAGAGAPAEYRVDSRAIIYTGTITVRVADVDAAAARATTIASAAGGFVGADKRSSNDRRSTATLELRVPAGRFGAAVDEVARLGEQESRSLDTEDVTEQVVDLDAKIASQQASVARTRALFAQAQTISEIVSVEAELAKRESELATLQARKRELDNLTTLSTITATLLGPEATADNEDRLGFLSGLRTGWTGFVGVMVVLVTVLGFVLPFAFTVGVPAVGLWWLLRRRLLRRRAPGPAR